ncbi:MAG: hypothetical protein MJ002_09285 [Paludibacteraceae bacterium]|nr:hypothetical protein [Paludibacteraceae bacterium]
MADDRIFNFNAPATFNDIHDNRDCTIIVPSPTENTQKAASQMASKPVRKSSLPTIPRKKDSRPRELMTFSKRGILDGNLTLLYSQMIEDGWIGKDTKTEDFISLFSGSHSEGTVIWAGKYGKGTLVKLFSCFEAYELIMVPKGFSIPSILMGHFVDEYGNFLTNLDKGDSANEKAGPEMMGFVKILKLNANRAGRRQSLDDDNELGYDDSLNEKDIKSDGLTIHKR